MIDLFSRRLLGYAMGERHDAELVVASLHMATATRGGDVRGVIFRSDRGSEYHSRRFRRACRRLGVTQSMGRVGSCFDNAVSEAFNSELKVEYVHRRTFATRTEARMKIATWITGFYNASRLHSVCGFRSPTDYERDYRADPRRGTGRIDRLHSCEGIDRTRIHTNNIGRPATTLKPAPEDRRHHGHSCHWGRWPSNADSAGREPGRRARTAH